MTKALTPAALVAKARARAKREALEAELALQMRAAGLAFEAQVPVWPGRNWRFDFAIPAAMLAIEVQGGIWRQKGAHNTGGAITRDCEKAAHACMAGWRVLPVTGDQVRSGAALQWITAAATVRPTPNVKLTGPRSGSGAA